MKTIHKYYVHHMTKQQIKMPEYAKIIDLKKIGTGIYLWAVVDPDKDIKPRDIYLIGTGHKMPEAYTEHIGTVEDEGFIWHFFEGIN